MQAVVDVVEQELAKGIVGAAVVVVADSEIVYSAGFGTADTEAATPISPQTAFPAQSVTKPVVATALMSFVERGAISLDEPVDDHLGGFRVPNRWQSTSPLTIRQLLTHTGGLTEWTGWHSTISVEDEVANHVTVELEPGTRMIYANAGYDILGDVLGRLATSPWDEAVTELVLRPLGMSATGVGEAPPGNPSHAAGHTLSQLDGGRMRLDPPPWPYHPPPPSGSLVSTADDLARFLLAHLSATPRILSPETLEDMHRLHAPLGPGGGGMGLGFRVDRRRGRAFFCHGGDGVGFTNLIGGHGREGAGVVVLINTGGAQEARSRIASAALDAALDEPPTGLRRRVLAEGSAQQYRSTYWGIRGELTEGEDGAAFTAVSGTVLSGESASRLGALGPRWSGEGGMFDGWDIDLVRESDGDWHLYGGVYPFEFVADPTPIIRLPTAVDEAGEPGGRWAGTLDTPFGEMPMELTAAPPATATVTVLGQELAVTGVKIERGWLTGSCDIDVPGIAAMTIVVRLGLVGDKLEGMLYARSGLGEFVMPTSLTRDRSQDQDRP